MTRWVAGVLAAGLMAGAGAAPAPREERDRPVFYLPTRVGDTAVYLTGGEETDSLVVTATQEKDGVTTVTWESRRPDGRVVGRRRHAASAGGVALVEHGEERFDPPLHVLKLPAKPGDTWGRKTVLGGVPYEVVATTGGVERVTVPAGTFVCVRVEMDLTFAGVAYRRNVWYAAGVGEVRSEMTRHQRRELKAFTPGKP